MRTSELPGRGTTTATAGFLVGGAGVALALATVLALTLLGVSLTPRGPAQAAATPTPAAPVPVVQAVDTPAAAVVTGTLVDAPSQGWVAASSFAATGGTPFDAACGRPATDAAVAGSRIYAIGPRQVVVTVLAYGAGAGAVAMEEWAQQLGSCPSSSHYAVPAPGVDAFLASVAGSGGRPPATALVWRRGDVIVVLATPSASPTGLAVASARLDARLLSLLAGRCTTVASTYADAVRSPWIDGVTFTGRTVQVPVRVTPSPVPTDGVASPVPLTWSPAPLPSVSLPTRPADPVWPVSLPTPVASPTLEPAPTPPPSATAIASREPDTAGPGCGWAFTGMAEPPYDAVKESQLAQARVVAAAQTLSDLQSGYTTNVLLYWQLVPQYQVEAAAWTAYVNAVSTVADAWATIANQRDAYQKAVAAYDAAVQAHNDFLNQQAAAQAAYDAELARCAAATAAPSASPTTSTSASPTDTVSPTASPSPSSTGVPGCPPVPPAILSQTAPPVPPVPTPPPDPRPSPTG